MYRGRIVSAAETDKTNKTPERVIESEINYFFMQKRSTNVQTKKWSGFSKNWYSDTNEKMTDFERLIPFTVSAKGDTNSNHRGNENYI